MASLQRIASQTTALGLLLSFSSYAQADLTPVFEYHFPDSYDGTTATLVDQSSTGNDGYMQSTGAFLPDFRPDGFATGGSIHGLLGGRAMTNNVDLLQNSAISAHGGFTMDAWVRWDEEDLVNDAVPLTQIVSYAGTLALMAVNNQLAFSVSLSDENGNEAHTRVAGPEIELGQWYHVVGGVNSEGHTIDGVGRLQADAFLIVDGQVQGTENPVSGLLHPIAAFLDRPIGLNAWPGDPSLTQGQFFGSGKVFNPSVYLGAVELPLALGDFNNDGKVDAADYTVWRDNLGSAFDLNGNGDESGGSAGIVDQADYDLWKAHFGEGSGAAATHGLGTTAVPEPSTAAALLICVALGTAAQRTRRCRGFAVAG